MVNSLQNKRKRDKEKAFVKIMMEMTLCSSLSALALCACAFFWPSTKNLYVIPCDVILDIMYFRRSYLRAQLPVERKNKDTKK